MLTAYFQDYLSGYSPYKGGRWCYEDGCIYRGLELLHKASGDAVWLDQLLPRLEAQLLPGAQLSGYELSEYNIDNVLSGRSLLYLYEVTGEARYLETAGLLAQQLATHPRTRSGVYWHKLRYPWQVWLDGLYMGLPFQIGYGQQIGDTALIEDALTQLGTALQMLTVEQTGLYAHAVDEARQQPWANKTSGHNPDHWARALGWLAMALVDIAELVGPQRFAPLKAQASAYLARLVELRQPDGLWLQVIDQPDLPGNYQESSASAMFTYALLRGAELGLNSPQPGLHDLLAAQFLRPKAGGGYEMAEICEVAGLGNHEGRFRDGSAAYYLSEARVADDAKGVGPLMMAHAAHLAATKQAMAKAG
ncbi:MAG: glycoside hydrolase family 88/105 protein [Mangrovicoccus sp.]